MPAEMDDVILIEVGMPGPPGSGVSSGNWTTIRSQVDTLLARPNINALDSLTDVTASGPANGQVLAWNGSAWVNVTPTANGIQTMEDGTPIGGATETRIVDFRAGLVAAGTGVANRVAVDVAFGTTAGTAAAGDHVHNKELRPVVQFGATGALSSGSRTLVTMNLGPLVPGVTYDVDAMVGFSAKNNVSSGTIRARVEVYLPSGALSGAVAEDTQQTAGGVPRWCPVETGSGQIVGTGSTIQVKGYAIFDSGDASDIRAGYIKACASPWR